MNGQQEKSVSEYPLHGRALIEASAGTGKTYTLALVYLRLVLGAGDTAWRDGLSPRDILVLTYTRAATEELRRRIRERLDGAAQALSGSARAADDEFLTELLAEQDPAHRQVLAERCAAAARAMDESAIHTLHGFCQRTLSEFAFAAGGDLALDLEQDTASIHRCALHDYWRRFVATLPEVSFRKFVGAKVGTPETFDASIRAWRKTQRRVEDAAQAAAEAASSESGSSLPVDVARYGQQKLALNADVAQAGGAVAAYVARHGEAMDGWLAHGLEPLPGGRKGAGPLGKGYVDSAREVLKRVAKAESIAKVKGLDRLLVASIKWNKGGEDAYPVSRELDECSNLVAAFLAANARQAALSFPIETMFSHAARWIECAESRQLSEAGRITFDTMVTRLRDALKDDASRGGTLAGRLRERYPVTLIDEFQDTDADQYGIFQRIYAGAEDSTYAWFMIGDPKQAIYGFRGGDLGTYLTAAAGVEDRCRYQLDENFRASKGVVTATNTLFSTSPLGDAKPIGEAPVGVFGNAGIRFLPVKSRRAGMALAVDTDPLRGMAPMSVCRLPAPPDDTVPGVGDARRMLSDYFAARVDCLLASGPRYCDHHGEWHPLQPKDIALLVRDRTQADALQEAFARRRLQTVYLAEHSNVFDSPSARDLLAILRAVDQPSNGFLIRAALAAKALMYSLPELAKLVDPDGDDWPAMLETFRKCRETWAHHGVLPMIHGLIHELRVPARRPSERVLTDLLHVAELLQRHDRVSELPSAGIAWLERAITDSANADNEADDAQLRLESERERVRIVTLHGAKGLEYPLVVLPFASVPVDPKRDDNPDEAMRLLYVGITRAKYACWLGLLPCTHGGGTVDQLERTPLGRLLFGEAHVDAGGITQRLHALQEASNGCIGVDDRAAGDFAVEASLAAEEPPLVQPYPELATRQPAYWGVTSYSGLAHGHHAHTFNQETERAGVDAQEIVDAAAPTVSASGIHQIRGGAAFGSLVHDMLETTFGPAFRRDDREAVLQLVAQRIRSTPWEEHGDLLGAWLFEVLNTPIGLAEGSQVSLAALETAVAESEFWLRMEPGTGRVDLGELDRCAARLLPGDRPALNPRTVYGMLKGYTDLLFRVADRYYVLDYKTNRLGSGDAAYTTHAMEVAMLASRYDLQALIYQQALHRLLHARLGARYVPARHLGGCVFLFVRGIGNATTHGAIHLPPLPDVIDAVEAVFVGSGSGGGEA